MLKRSWAVFMLALTTLSVGAVPTSIRVVSDNNYPPYLFIDADNNPRGYLVDEWALWEKKTGVKVDLIATDWSTAQKMLLAGDADVIDMMFETPARKLQYDFTAPYARVRVNIYVDASISGIDDVQSLKGFAVGVERGDACVERLARDGITNVQLFNGYTDMIAAVGHKDVRILCMDELPANYYLYKARGKASFSKSFEYYAGEFRRGVRKGDLATIALVEKGMKEITPQEREALRRRWMGQPVSFTPYAQVLGYALLVVGVIGVLLAIWVVTLRRAVSRRTKDLGFLSFHDALTGLPNRALLIDRLDHAIRLGQAETIAVLLIDLDHFSRIIESLGHACGDQLVKQVANRLTGSIEHIHTFARTSVDVFALVIQGDLTPAMIAATAEKVLRLVSQEIVLDGNRVFISASIGISAYPGDGNDGALLLKHAGAARSLARREGGGRFKFYRAALTANAQELIHMGAGLRRALQEDEFLLLYQPQIEISTGAVVGVEALLRWNLAGRLIGPDQFIPYAEETGLIEGIGDWVLQTACHQLAKWLRLGLPPMRVAVNLSPKQFANSALLDHVADALGAAGLPPELLELEITEGCFLQREASVLAFLDKLRETGVSLAIDDFGTGYSSLAYLRRFPVQILKIDKTFLIEIPGDRQAEALVSAIVAMARGLSLKVLAEGVENHAQWSFLKDIGCDLAQGWLLGAPMSAEAFMDWYKERSGRAEARRAKTNGAQ